MADNDSLQSFARDQSFVLTSPNKIEIFLLSTETNQVLMEISLKYNTD